jgi:putative addiction module component (TIGR02574 family)
MIAAPLLNEVLNLSVDERYELIEAIEQSVQPSSAELTALMAEEAEDRIAAFERGEIKALDGPTVMAELKARLAS